MEATKDGYSPLFSSYTGQTTHKRDSDDDVPRLKTYKRRWYVLSLYTAIALVCNMEWNTWGPISQPCQIVFGWGNWQILLLSGWTAIAMIVSALFMIWVIDERGLRVSVILCALLMTAGKAFQVIPVSDPTMRTVLINIGQFIAMLSCPVGFGGSPFLSANWFPPNERTTATAIGTLVPYSGLSAAFIIGPYMVPVTTIGHANSTNVTLYNMERMRYDVTLYMGVQLVIGAFLLICVLIYFPDKPPLPPSASCEIKLHSYREALTRLFQDRSYLHLAFIFSINFGVYFAWMNVLTLALKPFGIGERLAGWLGCAANLAGCCSGVIIARCVDYVKRQTKSVLIILCACTSISQLLFSLTCSRIIPFSETLLYSSIILGGLFFNGTIPLLFEMAIETVYPIAEGLTTVMLLAGGTLVHLIFVITFIFPETSVAWMNWVTVVIIGISVPVLLIYKAKYKRLDLDEDWANNS